MQSDIVEGIRQAIADFVAPDLREIKGRLEGLDPRLTAAEKALNARIDGLEQVIKARFDALDQKLDLLLKRQALEPALGHKLPGRHEP